jgi:hypothetical protein
MENPLANKAGWKIGLSIAKILLISIKWPIEALKINKNGKRYTKAPPSGYFA